jgi:hypothetical protein
MVAYRGPRDGHDAWQGDAYHQHLMEATADHIGHPKHLAHELAEMNPQELKTRMESAGPISKGLHKKAMEHQAAVNRAHPSYSQALKRRAKLVKHAEHHAHGTSTDRQLEIHAELKAIQDKLAHIENTLGD